MKRLLFSLLLVTISLSATTINVPADQATIQAGINAAVNGDTVLVQPGTYVENINFSSKNIVVGSLFLTTQDTSYISQTVIDGNQSGSVVTIETGENSSAVLYGFKITNGNGYTGGGIHCDSSSPTLSYLYVSNNYAIGGGGIATGSASPTLKYITVTNNQSNNGGGIVVSNNGSPIIRNCVIKSNSSIYDGGGLYFGANTSNSITENVLIYENTCVGRGGGVWFSQTSPTIVNATVVNNNADLGAGIYSYNNSVPTLVNSIVWDASAVGEIVQIHETASINFTHSDVLGGWSGEGNFASNPQFYDENNRDFRLSKSSPCIGAGLDTTIVPSIDIDGNSRPTPAGSNPDLGAYENSHALPHNSFINVSTSGDDNSSAGLELAPFATIQAAIEYSESGDTVLVQPGTYVENINYNGKNIVVGSLFLTTRDTSYISQTVIDGSQAGSVVSFHTNENTAAKIIGITITNGLSSTGGGVQCVGTSPRIEHCYIQNNSAGQGGGIFIDGGDPIVQDNHITNNIETQGDQNAGGIFITNGGGGIVIRNTITNNSGIGLGSGIEAYVPSDLIIRENIISGNSSAGENGGITVWYDGTHQLEITNNLIYQNSSIGIWIVAGNGGGSLNVFHNTIYDNAGDGISFNGTYDILSLKNNIITDNGGYGISATGTNYPDNNFNCVSGNGLSNYHFIPAGENDTNANPFFHHPTLGDFELLDWSPCIGAGDPSVLIINDLATNVRPNPAGSSPDIGAYENPLGTPQHMPITINIPDDYATIQAGLNAADSTDTVLVQPGTYAENIIWPETNGIKLLSAGDTSNTIIDGGGNSSVIAINGSGLSIDSTTVIRGFKITNGTSIFYGGGIALDSVANPILEDLLFVNNSAYYGGALSCKQSSPIIRNSSARNNTGIEGGALYFYDHSNATITDIELSQNTANKGGGVFFNEYSSLTVSMTNISRNVATLGGGGIFCENGSTFYMTDSEVSFNSCYGASWDAFNGGGGIYTGWACSTTILNSTIRSNYSAGYGGGCRAGGTDLELSEVMFINNNAVIQGGGLNLQLGQAFVRNSSFIQNKSRMGGALEASWVENTTILDNNLFVNNSAENGGAIQIENSNPVFTRNTISNNAATIQGGGIWSITSIPVFNQNNIYRNGMGYYNNSDNSVLNLTNNYWGDSSGPYHVAYNTSGLGDTTSMFTNPTPFLTDPNVIAPPIPIQNVEVTDSGNDFVSISWESSPLPDLASYRLYYGTDTTDYTYANSINLQTLATEYTVGGLSLATTYFFAVTCIDTADNESWYSMRATGVTRVIEVQNLDIAGEEDIQHLVTHSPGVSFEYYDSMSEPQTNYQIQVSSYTDFSIVDMWESGEVASDLQMIPYAGEPLNNGQTYYLRAKVASGAFWSDWSTLTFRMNSEPILPIQVSLIANEVTTDDVVLEIMNSSDAENDNLTYDFRLYDATQITQLDSAIAVTEVAEGTIWEVITTLEDNAQHWWTVRAYDGYEYSELAGPASFLINLENDTPADFNLTSPLAGEAIVSQSPLFTWNPAFDPDPLDTVRYVLYLDTPAPGVETFNVDIDTSFQLLEVLEDNTNYHWKVVASDLVGATTTSTGGYQSFRVNTENDLPTDFQLLSPLMGEMVTTPYVHFRWESSSDPDDGLLARMNTSGSKSVQQMNDILNISSYLFYLDTDNLFTETIPVEVYAPEYWAPDSVIEENLVYYWRVAALDNDGGIVFSDTASFWTNAINEPPSDFSLQEPSESEVITELSPVFAWESSSDPDLEDIIQYSLLLGTNPMDLESVWSTPDTLGTGTSVMLEWTLEDNQTYYWGVSAADRIGLTTFNDGGYHSFTVNTSNDLPTAFTLLSPDNNAMVNTLTPEFLWEASSDPDDATIVLRSKGKDRMADHSNTEDNSVMVITGYDFYLSTDASLAGATPVEVLGTSYVPIEELLENQVYYWAVSAHDDSGGVTFSDTASFWTNSYNDHPSEFSMLEPVSDNIFELDILTPTYRWNKSIDPDLYDEVVYHLSLWHSPWQAEEIYVGSDTSYTHFEPLLDNYVYSWEVIAEDMSGAMTAAGIGDSVAQVHFYTNTENDIPEPAVLLSPDSVVVLTSSPTFIWEASFDRDPFEEIEYEVHWWYDGGEMDSILTLGTSETIPEPLVYDNYQYYWQVITLDDEDGIAHSVNKTFWVDFLPEPPGLFSLAGPEDESAGNSTRPELTWQEAIDPDPFDNVHYRVNIATDSSMANIVYEGISIPEIHVPEIDLQNDTRYYWQVSALDEDSLQTLSDVWTFDVGYLAVDDGLALPTEYVLDQNYPNPFNPSTTLRYGLPEEASVSLIIYDIRGNTVKTFTSESKAAGWYEHTWNGIDDSGQPVSTGLYLTRLQAGSYSKVIKMLYLK